ncbi:hypothetical protein FSARC_2951 [Fusarium sarcochroum]|uniref:Uncharacterized protein n=1 Tax=Fusarium sarcochroum TaxID=1208366 RepID=A0A8H4U5G6_9HYPO|nr:hypothetical protein FSARC_2951 [Fusarium sarcochroum]
MERDTIAARPDDYNIYANDAYCFGRETKSHVVRNVADWSLVKRLETLPSPAVTQASIGRWEVLDPCLVHCVGNYPVTEDKHYGHDLENHVEARLVELDILPIEKRSFDARAVDRIRQYAAWMSVSDGTVVIDTITGQLDFMIVTPEGQEIDHAHTVCKCIRDICDVGRCEAEEWDDFKSDLWLDRFIVTYLSNLSMETSREPPTNVIKISSKTGRPLVRLEILVDRERWCWDWYLDPLGGIVALHRNDSFSVVPKISTYDFCKVHEAQRPPLGLDTTLQPFVASFQLTIGLSQAFHSIKFTLLDKSA